MKKKIAIISVIVLIIGLTENLYAQWYPAGLPGKYASNFVTIGSNLFVNADNGIQVTQDYGGSWMLLKNGPYLGTFIGNGSNLYVYGTNYNGEIYLSTDTGTTWIDIGKNFSPSGADRGPIQTIGIIGPNLFVVIFSGIFRSPDNGASWNKLDSTSGLKTFSVTSFVTVRNRIFALSDSGVSMSADSGKLWNNVDSVTFGFPVHSSIQGYYVFGTNRFATTASGPIYTSTNDGKSWTIVGSPNGKPVWNLFESGTNLFAAALTGVKGEEPLYLSTNNGSNWTSISFGLPQDILFNDFTISGPYLFASYQSDVSKAEDAVYRRSLSDFGINDVKNRTKPDLNIFLSPNPTTGIITIHNAPANIFKVTILNVLGESVVELAHPNAPDFTLDLSKLPRGMYYTRLVTANSVEERKIIKQ